MDRLSDTLAPTQVLGRFHISGHLFSDPWADAPARPRVLDLTAELPELPALRGPGYLCLPVVDGLPVSDALLDEAVAFALDVDGPVLVHCALGRERSGVVMAAIVLAAGAEATVDAALARVQSMRPQVQPNAGQRVVLAAWWARRQRVRAGSIP